MNPVYLKKRSYTASFILIEQRQKLKKAIHKIQDSYFDNVNKYYAGENFTKCTAQKV